MLLATRIHRGLAADPFDQLQRELGATVGQLLNGADNSRGSALVPYRVDVREDVNHLTVEAELPGFKKEDIEITLENQTVTISAQRKDAAEKPEGEWLLNERRYSQFLRSFTLPTTVDEQAVDAKLSDGVLTVTLNKREESKPRRITVA